MGKACFCDVLSRLGEGVGFQDVKNSAESGGAAAWLGGYARLCRSQDRRHVTFTLLHDYYAFEILAGLPFIMDMIDTVGASAIWTRRIERETPYINQEPILQKVG